MDTTGEAAATNPTTVERRSDREVVVTRTFDAPARLVFEAWSKPELFRQWWVPKSLGMTLHACEMDVRTGGTYRLSFGEGMDFFGRYLEVTPPTRIVWTNEEGGDSGLERRTVQHPPIMPEPVGAAMSTHLSTARAPSTRQPATSRRRISLRSATCVDRLRRPRCAGICRRVAQYPAARGAVCRIGLRNRSALGSPIRAGSPSAIPRSARLAWRNRSRTGPCSPSRRYRGQE